MYFISMSLYIGLLALTAHLTVGQYVNDEWDTDFEFECETGESFRFIFSFKKLHSFKMYIHCLNAHHIGEHIYYATSKFDSSTRSRKWGFDCRYGFVR